MKKVLSTEERNKMLDESRLFYLSQQAVVPMLTKRRKIAFEKMLSKFRTGETNFLPDVAELNSLFALEKEFEIQSRMYETLMEEKK